VITSAALCPSPPLLYPGITGRQTVVPELRAACAEAVRRLVRGEPEVIVVVGPAGTTRTWAPASRLDPSQFAPAMASTGIPSLPLSLGLGAMLLDEAQYRGRRRLQAIGQDEPPSTCVGLGAELGMSEARTALLVMGDGSARRTLKAPGYLDPRAAALDSVVENAIRTGDLDALQQLDPILARELMVTGRPAWQVLSGAWHSSRPRTEILYSDAPFGVAYLVAQFQREGQDERGFPAPCLGSASRLPVSFPGAGHGDQGDDGPG
jgi:hypothetical protein